MTVKQAKYILREISFFFVHIYCGIGDCKSNFGVNYSSEKMKRPFWWLLE